MHPRIPLAFLAARAHCWLMVNLLSIRTPRSLSVELLSSRSAPACTGSWGYSSLGAGPCACPCWTSSSSSAPNSPASPGHAEWQHSLPVYLPLLPASCHQRTCWGYIQGTCRSKAWRRLNKQASISQRASIYPREHQRETSPSLDPSGCQRLPSPELAPGCSPGEDGRQRQEYGSEGFPIKAQSAAR